MGREGRPPESGRRAAVAALLALVIVLNVLDALFTSRYLAAGLATEANPIMRLAWEASPAAFFGLKLLLVGAGALVLWWQRHRAFAVRALQVAAAIYAGVLALHLSHAGELAPLLAVALR